MRLQDQLVDLAALLADMEEVGRTTDGEGGVVTEEAVAAVRRFVQLIAEGARSSLAERTAST
jgi:hypothetical protein